MDLFTYEMALSSQDNIVYDFNKTKLLCRAPNVTQVTFPATLTEIADDAFYHCTSLGGTVILPANLKTIGGSAFSNCNKVDAFDFSQCTKLTSIEGRAFSSCTKITAMNLPASLETIAASAFSGCTNLTTLTVDAANTHLSSQDNIVYDSGKTKLLCCTPNVTQVTFPATLTEIADGAFCYCPGLTEVHFPASLTKIGISAFAGCREITGTVVMPANLKTIGNCAFHNCDKVDAFDFTQCTQLTSIGGQAFQTYKADAVFTVKAGGNIKNLLLNSQSGIKTSQITEVP
ncbi:leucine-rich repeat protein [Treponema socranskii]